MLGMMIVDVFKGMVQIVTIEVLTGLQKEYAWRYTGTFWMFSTTVSKTDDPVKSQDDGEQNEQILNKIMNIEWECFKNGSFLVVL